MALHIDEFFEANFRENQGYFSPPVNFHYVIQSIEKVMINFPDFASVCDVVISPSYGLRDKVESKHRTKLDSLISSYYIR